MKLHFGRAAGRTTAPGRKAPQSPDRRATRAGALFLAALLTTALTACGVKNDLVKPNAKPDKADESNPSRPPSGGNTPSK